MNACMGNPGLSSRGTTGSVPRPRYQLPCLILILLTILNQGQTTTPISTYNHFFPVSRENIRTDGRQSWGCINHNDEPKVSICASNDRVAGFRWHAIIILQEVGIFVRHQHRAGSSVSSSKSRILRKVDRYGGR